MQAERINFLKDAQKNYPKDPFYIYALALEYKKENPAECDKIFKQLLVEFPEYLATYYTAGIFFEDTEQYELAKSTFEKGIVLAQNNPKALGELKAAYNNLIADE